MNVRDLVAGNVRGLWDRANVTFKSNSPDGWVDDKGPVWWVNSDKTRGWLNPIDGTSGFAGMAAVTKAAGLIVNPLASADWHAGDGTPRWLADPMLLRPDGRIGSSPVPRAARLNRSTFWGNWIRSALLWGMGWIVYAPDFDGQPVPGTMRVWSPARVGWDPWEGAFYLESERSPRAWVNGEGQIEGTGLRLLPLRNPRLPADPDSGVTPGTLAWHAAELGLIPTMTAYATSNFAGAGVPSGYLKVNQGSLTQTQADELKRGWHAAHGGPDRTTAILSAAVDYQALAVSPVDAGLIDMKRLSLLDVANAFGVPAYMLGAEGPSMTYSNLEMEKASLYEFTLAPWAVAVEETLSALLPGDVTVAIDTTGEVTRGTAAPGVGDAPADVPQG